MLEAVTSVVVGQICADTMVVTRANEAIVNVCFTHIAGITIGTSTVIVTVTNLLMIVREVCPLKHAHAYSAGSIVLTGVRITKVSVTVLSLIDIRTLAVIISDSILCD